MQSDPEQKLYLVTVEIQVFVMAKDKEDVKCSINDIARQELDWGGYDDLSIREAKLTQEGKDAMDIDQLDAIPYYAPRNSGRRRRSLKEIFDEKIAQNKEANIKDA